MPYANSDHDDELLRTEALLQNNQVELDRLSPTDHDSQIYQIELELQNQGRYETPRALEAACVTYQDLYDVAPVGYFLLNQDRYIVESNLMGSKLLGETRLHLYQRHFDQYVHAPHHHDYVCQCEKALDTQCQTSCELLIVRQDGTPFQGHLEITARHDDDGALTHLCLVLIDITERMRQEEGARARLEAQLRQAQKLEAIGTLAGGIAHDFNNSLAIMMRFTEVAQSLLSPSHPVCEHLQEVLTTAKRGKELVHQMLVFSRQHSLERRPLQLRELLRETQPLLRASLPATIDLQVHLNTTSGRVLANATQLQQVIMNLCSNAEYAMRESGGTLQIVLDVVEVTPEMSAAIPDLDPGSYVRLDICDTGSGITTEDLPRIFEPFFTTKGIEDGTGMGLAIVHGIIVGYGGAINVTSVLGQGTTFEIYLEHEIEDVVALTEPAEARPPTGHGHILFVDDEEGLGVATQILLTDLGYEVSVYTDAEAALADFDERPDAFDVVIADQTMPQMTGRELADAMRVRQPDIPIILCTGYSHVIDEAQAASQGIHAFLMKPMDIYELAATVQRVLRQRGGEMG